MQPIARQGEQFNLTGERFPQRHPVDEEGLQSFLGGRSVQAGYNNPRQAGQGLPMGVPSGYQYRQQDANQPRYKEDFMPGYEGADAYPSRPREGLPMGSLPEEDRSRVPQNHPSRQPRHREDFMPGYEGADAYPSRTAGWGSPSPEDYDDTGDEAAWEEDQQGLGLHQLGEPPQHHLHPDELHEGPHDPYDEHGGHGLGGLGGGYDDYDHGLSAHEAEFG